MLKLARRIRPNKHQRAILPLSRTDTGVLLHGFPRLLYQTTVTSRIDDIMLLSLVDGSLQEPLLLESLVRLLGERAESLVVNGSESHNIRRMDGILNIPGVTARLSYTGSHLSRRGIYYHIIDLLERIKKTSGRHPDCVMASSRMWAYLCDPFRQPQIVTLNRSADNAIPSDRPARVGSINGVSCYISDAISDTEREDSPILAFNSQNVFIAESSSTPTISAHVNHDNKSTSLSTTVGFTAQCSLNFGVDPASIGILEGIMLEPSTEWGV